MNTQLLFQFCQKIVLFSEDQSSVLLAKRQDEADYDGMYSFIGGKLETTDGGIVAGLSREKNEEIGEGAIVEICPLVSYNVYITKNDGNAMVLPHYYARFKGGEIALNEEYSEYKWVTLDELASFEPKIGTIEECVAWAQKIRIIVTDADFVEI